MARKDVDLVIRAKDEAEGVIKAITNAFNDFIAAQKDMSGQAGKTESALGKVGAATAALQRQIEKLNVGDKIAADVDKAAQAVARLEAASADTEKEISDLNEKLAASATATEKFQTAIKDSATAVDRQKAAIKASKTEIASLKAQYAEVTVEQEKLSKRAAELPAAIEKQAAATDKAVERNAKLKAEMADVAVVSKSLQNAFDASERSVASQTQKLQALQTELVQSGPRLAELATSAQSFATSISQSEGSLAKEQATLARLSKELIGTRNAASEAAKGHTELEQQIGKAENRAKAITNDLARARTGYTSLTEAAQRFNAAIQGGTEATRDNLASQIVEQGLAAQRAKTDLIEYEQAVSKLASDVKVEEAFGRSGQAAKEYATQLKFAKQAANEASLVEGLHREALQRMGQAFAGAKQDAAGLAGLQATLASEQQRLAASLAQVAAEGFQERSAIRDMGAAARTAASDTDRLASATQKAASATGGLGAAYRSANGDARTTLDLTQRLRGQVLSLIAAYGGLFGVINTLGKVVDAYQTLEGAQARLNVANNGNVDQSAKDLDFLRRNAERLGIELGTLATEYSKFAIATQGTNLEGEKTRKIFLAVAEAARVNRSSNEEMQGVFTALTQIVSKGAVQMEELRQQLGDRLPGALQLMADGLGVTTAELIKMMEQGQVTADALVPFAEELTKKFGPGLQESLGGVTVAMGRLKNAVFEALTEFGKQGFIESFVTLLNKITAFIRSSEFVSFSQQLASAFSGLVSVLGFVIDNFRLFTTAISAFIGLKFGGVIVGIIGNFTKFAGTLRAAAAGLGLVSTAATTAGAAATTAATGITLLEAAAGPIGLLVAAIGAGIGIWLTATNDATDAMVAHREIVDQVKNAYDAVGGSVTEWRSKLNDVTEQSAIDNERQQFEALDATIQKISQTLFNAGRTTLQNVLPGSEIFLGASSEYTNAVRKLLQNIGDGKVSVFQFREELDKLAGQYRDDSAANGRLASELDKLGAELEANAQKLKEAQDIHIAVAGSADEAQAAFDRLGNKAKETAVATTEYDTALQALQKTQEEIAKAVPKAATETEVAAQRAQELATNFEAALKAARGLPDAIMRAAAEQQVLAAGVQGMADLMSTLRPGLDQQFGNFSSGTEAATALVKSFEGFISTPKYDVNAFRAGYGSDTVTLADGSVQKIVEGMHISVEDANRDLARRITTEFMPIASNAVGAEIFNKLLPQQQAVLTSIAYNFGKIPQSVAEAVKTGSTDDVVTAIQNLGARGRAGTADEAGARARTAKEAALYGSTAGVDAVTKAAEKRAEEEAKAAEKAQEYHDTLGESLAAEQQITAAKQQGVIAEEQAKAIAEAQAAAKRAGTTLTEEEIAKIKEATAAKYAEKAAEDATRSAREKAADAEQRVTALLEQQRALQEQLKLAQRDGDTAKQDELKAKLEEVNAEITAGIAKAKELWQAVGGADAETAQVKLDTAALRAQNLAGKAEQVYFAWNKVGDLFINGISSAFDRFAQAVAEGENPLVALRNAFLQFASDFLREIAQMIIKQAIFNALQGTKLGGFLGIGVGTGHTGGMVGSKLIGSGNASRKVNPAVFAGAIRYHSGGIAGLRPGEVPAILKEGENVQTANDPFHPNNLAGTLAAGGGKSGGGGNTKIVNAIDSASFLAAALQSEVGERVLLNWLRANSDAVNSARA